MAKLSERPTSDLVVLFLAGMIGVVVILGVLGLAVLKIARPDESIDSSVKVIGDILTTTLGAVIGFVAGKATGSTESIDINAPPPGDGRGE